MSLQAPALNLDPAQAIAADAGGRISSTGGFIGVITQMKWRASGSGAAGYVIDFETVDGQKVTDLFICTVKRDGTPSEIGERQMSALLCCLGMRTTNPVQARIMEDVYNENLARYEELQVNAFIYPDVCNRQIGLILQKELTSRASDGKDSYRMQYVRSYHAENMRTAAEMIAATQAQKLGKPIPPAAMVHRTLASIEDKDSRNKEAISHHAKPTGTAYEGSTLNQPANGATTDYEDDIPF